MGYDWLFDFLEFWCLNLLNIKQSVTHFFSFQCSVADFNVIGHANTEYKLRIKDAIRIQWQKPVLDIQKNFACKMKLYIMSYTHIYIYI